MTFVPNPDVLAAFTLAAFVLILTPGPDMTLFIGETLRAGRARGFAAMFGAVSGVLIHSTLAAVGLSALLAASVTAYTVLKIVGVAYLLWLALQAIRHGSALTVAAEPGTRRPLAQSYLMGLGVNLLNPKIVMFFVTFLPQFVSANDPHATGKLLFLGVMLAVIAFPFCALMILFAARLADGLRRAPKLMRIVDWAFAGVFGAFAVRLLFTQRQ
jgi:threonine/homoserine/homoserine lactone efflux protein